MRHTHKLLTIIILVVLGGAGALASRVLALRNAQLDQTSPLHPTFALLDADGLSVLESQGPVSTMQTCGQCHDAEYIASHSYHADLGLANFSPPGSVENGRPWDQSDGSFGKWSPLTYAMLTTQGAEPGSQDIATWIRKNARRFVGGGPGVSSQDGVSHLESEASGGEWDWQASGVVELNCFLCHTPQPDNAARIAALEEGQFGWAATATLLGSGLVEQTAQGYRWQSSAFAENGELAEEFVFIQDPTNQNCAQCHGRVQSDETPLTLTGCSLDDWQTATTGQVISGEKISASGMNQQDKSELTRPWDVHAERGLSCTDCHYSLNNPAYYQSKSSLEHLLFDPRRLEIGEYLEKPNHNFARGQSAQNTIAPELKGTMRRCEGCHDATKTHDWLPYAERHLEEVACETCHIPSMAAPAVQSYDWTALQADGSPLVACRGVEGKSGSIQDLVTGFKPALLPRQSIDGQVSLAPYNLITAWYWVHDSSQGPQPVALSDLKAAYFDGESYASEVLEAFDADNDGQLTNAELALDSPAEREVIQKRLAALGLDNPQIKGEILAQSINHNVVGGDWATWECKTCHSDASLIASPMRLADHVPGGVQPEFVKDVNTATNGEMVTSANGALFYQPATTGQKLYIFGHNRVSWIDWTGIVFFLGVLGAVSVHGGFRFAAALRAPRGKVNKRKEYMYGVYERFWHWLQTFAIMALLFTGLIIHRPDVFGIFSFRYVVLVHNVLAALLVLNAALSLFYHLVSGEIKQFIPHPYGFFDQAIVQAKFYLQGIFRDGKHPFEKTPEKKLNPLQQVTYFGILNVLLPLQIITGALMWGVQHWPASENLFGGLPVLAPFHSLVAWMFASFIVAHVYLTTTGAQPFTSIKAMINGWDEIEIHDGDEA